MVSFSPLFDISYYIINQQMFTCLTREIHRLRNIPYCLFILPEITPNVYFDAKIKDNMKRKTTVSTQTHGQN